MRALLKWHACEEIEHKSVTFDVLEEVGGGYAIRQVGLLLATLMTFAPGRSPRSGRRPGVP